MGDAGYPRRTAEGIDLGLADDLLTYKGSVDATLARLLPEAQGPARSVCEAMRYAVLGDGKRLRPILVVAACEACGGNAQASLAPAAAIELIHAYSLIHDDLPLMDDDDLRRGRPTVHRAFDEATALLAGDALQALAFEILATHPPGGASAPRRVESSLVVAAAVGAGGMVGGQAADLSADGRSIEPDQLRWIHEHKTGALFAASAEVGAIHAGATASTRAALRRFGFALGLAFQVTDDILDVVADTESLGKTAGKDADCGKMTYPALYGVERARQQAHEHIARVCDSLSAWPSSARLQALARYIETRMQ